MRNRIALGVLAAVVAGWTSPSLLGTTLRFVNLEEMTLSSQRIFVGTCLNRTRGEDPRGIPYTLYTFEITNSIAGIRSASHVTFKQFGFYEPAQGDSRVRRFGAIAGMPSYEPGQSYLLFLGPESRLGFSGPVGLGQGVFAIRREGTETMAVNAVGNRNLALDTSQKPLVSPTRKGGALTAPDIFGPVPLQSLIDLVKSGLSGRRLSPSRVSSVLSKGVRR